MQDLCPEYLVKCQEQTSDMPVSDVTLEDLARPLGLHVASWSVQMGGPLSLGGKELLGESINTNNNQPRPTGDMLDACW